MKLNDVVGIEDVMEMLNVGRARAWELIKANETPFKPIGRTKVFLRSDVKKLIKQRDKNAKYIPKSVVKRKSQ